MVIGNIIFHNSNMIEYEFLKKAAWNIGIRYNGDRQISFYMTAYVQILVFSIR